MGRMHQTTVRFGSDLWEALELECERLGVSAAQYLREAALARLAYSAGRHGVPAYEQALVAAGASPLGSAAAPGIAEERHVPSDALQRAHQITIEQGNDSLAVAAQSAQVTQRSREIRERSRALRARTHGTRTGANDDDVA